MTTVRSPLDASPKRLEQATSSRTSAITISCMAVVAVALVGILFLSGGDELPPGADQEERALWTPVPSLGGHAVGGRVRLAFAGTVGVDDHPVDGHVEASLIVVRA